jgi:hypothetical protein
MFVIHETLPNKRKFEKIMQCPSIKFLPLWYGSDCFPKNIYYYAFIVQKCKKHTFLNEISSKNFKSLNRPRFNSIISISYTIKKFTQKFHS